MYTSSQTAASPMTARKKRGFRQSTVGMLALVRASALPVGQAAGVFLASFVRWFGVPSPFAAALLLADAKRPKAIWLVGLAAALGLRALWGLETDIWQYAGCLALWLIRRRCQPKSGIETAAMGGLVMMPRVFAALIGGAPLNILLSCASVPLCMLAAAAMRCGVDSIASTGAPTSARERVCVMLLALVMVSGLGYFGMGPVNLGHAAGVLITVAYARANGSAYGVAGGVFCGLALALSGHDARLALPSALCGLMCGLAPVVKHRWLCVPAAMVASLLAFAIMNLAAPPLSLWAAGVGSIVYVLIPNALCEQLCDYLRGHEAGARSMESAFVTQHVSHMQDAVRRLAEALPPCGNADESAGEALGALLCAQCANRELCWGRGRARTERMLTSMMELAEQGEEIDESKLPALAGHGCLRADVLPELAQDALISHKRHSIAMKKARYERELTLTHLSALSGALGELGRMALGESLNDLQAAHVITLAMEELHMPARLSYARRIDGHLRVALETEGMMPIQKPLENLLRFLAKEEELPLSISRAEHGRIELEEIPLYNASVGSASVCAGERGEHESTAVCGDACSTKRCEGGRLLMMLCDGMGHGEAAHKQSEKTLELLLLLLEAGYTRRQAITAVNGIMLGAQEDERFSTVDMADVDLWTGEVILEKLGACASWVVRGNHLKKIEGSSLPLGIMEEAAPTATQYRLHSGDILILMSDGVADAFESDEDLRRALSESLYIQPQRMADALLRNALLAGGGTPRDDMSVMVLLLIDRQQSA